MAGRAGAGELRTRIFAFDKPGPEVRNANGYRVSEPVNVFGEGASRRCKWVNAHGNEVYHAMQAGVEECATLTLRYTPKITPTYTKSRTIHITHSDGRPDTVLSTEWTQKGRLRIHEILTARGILAVMDRDRAP